MVGLGENSRIKTKSRGGKVPLDTELLMAIVDKISTITWGFSGGDDKSRPNFILEKLYNEQKEDINSVDRFTSGEEFMKAWKEASNG